MLDGFINSRLREILDKYPWSRLIKTSTLQTVAIYETGTVAVTNGSTAVTGTGTTFTAGMTGRRFRVEGREEYYTFTRTAATTGTLDRAYEGDDDTGATYKIFQPIATLPSDCDVVESLKSIVENRDLDQIERETLDKLNASRESYGSPLLFAPYDDDSTPLPQIELYPIPEESEGMILRYKRGSIGLTSSSDELLTWINEHCLIAGVEADLLHMQGDYVGAQVKEVRFGQLLNDMIRLETTREVPQQLRMADRFTSHRRARAMRNDDDDERWILRRS